jgi:hypothetical protein
MCTLGFIIIGLTCAASRTVRRVRALFAQQWPLIINVMALVIIAGCRSHVDLPKIVTRVRLYKHGTFIESFVAVSNRLPHVITEHLSIAPIGAEITGYDGLLYDGWGHEFVFEQKDDQVIVTSSGADVIRGTSDDLILQCTTSSASLVWDGRKEDL